MVEPIRQKLRKDIEEPKCKKSNIDMDDPSRVMPKTDIADPNRRKLLMDIVDPICVKSKSDIELPKAMMP